MGVTKNGRRFVPHFRGHCVPLSIHRPYIKDHVQRRGCQWVLQIYLAYWASAWHALVPDTHSVKIKAQKNNRPVSKQYGYFLTKLWGANRLSVTPFLIVILSHCLPYVNFPAKVFRYTNVISVQLSFNSSYSTKTKALDFWGIQGFCGVTNELTIVFLQYHKQHRYAIL